MLLLRKEKQGVWFPLSYRGADIRLKIIPADPDAERAIRKKHTKIEPTINPATKQVEKLKLLDNDAYVADIADHLIEDWEGIGYSPAEPLLVTKANKLTVAMLPPGNGEQSLWDFVIEKSNELRTLTEEEAQALEKN